MLKKTRIIEGLKLGLIDGDNAVTTICQRAITDARATGQCTAEAVEFDFLKNFIIINNK